MTGFKLLSFNVRGLGNPKKRRMVLSSLKKQDTDIVFLQETHSTKTNEKIWKSEWGSKFIYFSHGKSNARGACIMFKNNVDFDVQKEIFDSSSRLVILKVTINGLKKVLINVYAPNDVSEAVDFLKKLNDVMVVTLTVLSTLYWIEVVAICRRLQQKIL